MSKRLGSLEAGKTDSGAKRELKFNSDKRLFSIIVDWKDVGKYLKDNYGPIQEWIVTVSSDGKIQNTSNLSLAEDKCEVKGLTPGTEYLVELFYKKSFPGTYTGADKNDYYYVDNAYALTFARHKTSIGDRFPTPPDWDKPDKLWDNCISRIRQLAETRLHKILVVGFAGHGKSSFFNTVLTSCAYNKFSTDDTVFNVADVRATDLHVTTKVCYHPINYMAHDTKTPLRNVTFVDTFGIRTDTYQGTVFEKILRGNAQDGWEIGDKPTDDNPKLKKEPLETDRCGCVIFVLAADVVDNKPSVTDPFYTTLQGFIKTCSDYDVKPLFLLTKVDRVDSIVASSYKSVFQSEAVLALANRLHQAFGVSFDKIFPVQNYHGSGRDVLIECGILRCVHTALVESDLRARRKNIPPFPPWRCSKCQLDNKESDTLCTACRHPRGADVPTPPPPKSDFVPPPPPQDWNCSQCTLLNDKTATVCRVCREQKPVWSCGKCTSINEPRSNVCYMCKTQRPLPKPEPIEDPKPPVQDPKPPVQDSKPQAQPWNCGCKDKKQPASLPFCSACKTRNPDAWNCGDCTSLNGNIDSCHSCHAPRPFICKACSTINPSTEPNCKTCDAPNPVYWSCSVCTRLNGPKSTQCGSCGAAKPKDWKCTCTKSNSGAVDYCSQCGKPKTGKVLLDDILTGELAQYTERFLAQGFNTKESLKFLLEHPDRLDSKQLEVKLGHQPDVIAALQKSKLVNPPPLTSQPPPGGGKPGGTTPTPKPTPPTPQWRCYQCRADYKMDILECTTCRIDKIVWNCPKCQLTNSIAVNKCTSCATLMPPCPQEATDGCFFLEDVRHTSKYLHKCKDGETCTKLGDADHIVNWTHPERKAPPTDPLQEWTIEIGLPDILDGLRKMEFTHPRDIVVLSEKDVEDASGELGLKFGRKSKFIQGVQNLKDKSKS